MSARDPALDERVVMVADALTTGGLDFALGGAIALAYYSEPRATIDIDINVFVGIDKTPKVLRALRPLGIDVGVQAEQLLRRDGQARLRWDRYLLDVFLSTHPFHDACSERIRRMPFGSDEIPILSAEDLVVFKTLFNRAKDWLDIEQVLFAGAGTFDIGYVESWIDRLAGKADERRARLGEAIANARGKP